MPKTDAGTKAAEDFFNKFMSSTDFQQIVENTNDNIVNIAKLAGFQFTYDDMIAHLITRWDVRKPPHGVDFCTT